MASDVTIAANAILAVLRGIVAHYTAKYPDIGGWEERAAAELPPIAGQLAKAVVDALAAAHGTNVVPIAGVPPMTDPTVTASPGVSGILQEVLGYLQVGCSVIADYSAIETLIATFPFGATATVVANTVCDAVRASPKKLAAGGAAQDVTVRGVRIPIHASPFQS